MLADAGAADPVRLSPAVLPGILVVVVTVVWLETARRSELVLLANLGHSSARIAALVVVQVLALEALVRVLLG